MVYTVRYNGESYFSDVVFQLTDDQKELASDYASNLSLFLGDGLLQNLEAWTGNSITALGDVTFTDGSHLLFTTINWMNAMPVKHMVRTILAVMAAALPLWQSWCPL